MNLNEAKAILNKNGYLLEETITDRTELLKKLKELKTIKEADYVIDTLKELGFYDINYGDINDTTSFAEYKNDDGIYVEIEYTWNKMSTNSDNYVYTPCDILNFKYYTDKYSYKKEHGFSPRS